MPTTTNTHKQQHLVILGMRPKVPLDPFLEHPVHSRLDLKQTYLVSDEWMDAFIMNVGLFSLLFLTLPLSVSHRWFFPALFFL